MADKPILYGFDGSTYVRTVRSVLDAKGIDYDQVPVNVLAGEPREPEHLARHPFGKVPVMDIDGVRIRETDAICRYLEDTHANPATIPSSAKDKARMNEAVSLINAYGYGAMISVAAYHLFPDFVGGQNEESREQGLEDTKTLLTMLMGLKGGDTFIAGNQASAADYLLGPISFYVSLTPDSDQMLAVPGMSDWWAAINGDEHFKKTEPDLG
jgi:glutathione S-transferase